MGHWIKSAPTADKMARKCRAKTAVGHGATVIVRATATAK